MTAKALVQGQVEGKEDLIAYREVDITRDTATARKYGVQVTPTTIILDTKGKVVDAFVGVPQDSELESALNKAIAS